MEFKVTCKWVVESTLTVEAESKEDAVEKAFDTETADFPDPKYVDDTFQVYHVERIR